VTERSASLLFTSELDNGQYVITLCHGLLSIEEKKKVRHFSRSLLFYEQDLRKNFIYVKEDFGGNTRRKDLDLSGRIILRLILER
jgi:hypothetical protein